MKIFYTTTMNGIDQDLDQFCPFDKKLGRANRTYLGSRECTSCEYCYGYGQHPSPFHNLMIIPGYSRNTPKNRDKMDSELPDYDLKNFKIISDCDYIKCLMCYNEMARKKFKYRFKVWYWKHIGMKISDLNYNIIDKWNDFKLKLKFKKY